MKTIVNINIIRININLNQINIVFEAKFKNSSMSIRSDKFYQFQAHRLQTLLKKPESPSNGWTSCRIEIEPVTISTVYSSPCPQKKKLDLNMDLNLSSNILLKSQYHFTSCLIIIKPIDEYNEKILAKMWINLLYWYPVHNNYVYRYINYNYN